MKDFQEEYYDDYHYPFQDDWTRINLLIKELKKRTSATKLLDIGCNNGEVSLKFKEAGYQVTGVDNSAKALQLALQRGIQTKKFNILQPWPYQDNSQDVIFCGETFEHLLKPQIVAKEALRILKPGGIFAVTVPNVSSLGNALLILAGRLPAHACVYDGPHVRDFCQRDLKRLLNEAGFKKIDFIGDKITIPIKKNKRIRIPTISKKYCDYIIAVATK